MAADRFVQIVCIACDEPARVFQFGRGAKRQLCDDCLGAGYTVKNPHPAKKQRDRDHAEIRRMQAIFTRPRGVPAGAVLLTEPQRAILARLAEGGHVTVRDCAAACDRVVSTTWVHLRNLRKLGLVTWEDGHAGTLRLAVRRVPVRL